jgi:hypothetical protein
LILDVLASGKVPNGKANDASYTDLGETIHRIPLLLIVVPNALGNGGARSAPSTER